ncbi:MAG: pyruvate kinase [Phycisphaerales bacterium]|jgi:pyruvate kinase|nr:pyruvate kinase [Phycisphaerales bacterium]
MSQSGEATLDASGRMRLPSRTKIVATIGPASDSPEMVRRLIEAGVNIFRFNFSHGTLEDHARRLGVVRKAQAELGVQVACLGDLAGPKIRLGQMPEAGIEFEAGSDVLLLRDASSIGGVGTVRDGVVHAPINYAAMIDEVHPGQRVLINDGAVRMLAVERAPDGSSLRCRVTVGGLVTSRKGINLPESDVRVEAVTEKDWACVAWAVEHGLDFLALSFVRRAEDVLLLKDRLAGMCAIDRERSEVEGSAIPVVAKIETPRALENIEAIVEATDAVMVARGDLGVEMDIARVPVEQKRILRASDAWGKPCIVATQMLESMITSATPTRAEAGDVATAIFDGADAVMLSAETATGKHPALVVETMRRIARFAEDAVDERDQYPTPPARMVAQRHRTASLAHGAWDIAHDIGARVIACWSQRGGTARFLSQTGFQAPIVAYTSSEREARRMCLMRGVTPVVTPPPESGALADWHRQVERDLLRWGWVAKGDYVVLAAGRPLGQAKSTNSVTALKVGDHIAGGPQGDPAR